MGKTIKKRHLFGVLLFSLLIRVSWYGAQDISSEGEEDAIATVIPHYNLPNPFSTDGKNIKIQSQNAFGHQANQNNTDHNIHVFPILGNELKEPS